MEILFGVAALVVDEVVVTALVVLAARSHGKHYCQASEKHKNFFHDCLFD